MRLFRAMQHESLKRNLIAQFFQCHFRWWKGGLCTESWREYLRQKRRDESLMTIQASVRRCSQRNIHLDLLTERKRLNNGIERECHTSNVSGRNESATGCGKECPTYLEGCRSTDNGGETATRTRSKTHGGRETETNTAASEEVQHIWFKQQWSTQTMQ